MPVHPTPSVAAHPDDFEAFLDAAQSKSADSMEFSLALGALDHARRAVCYFDARRPGNHAGADARALLFEVADALHVPIAPAVRDWMDDANVAGALQLAVGIDARPDGGTRLKFYVICDSTPCAARENVGALAGVDAAAARDAHIVALDLTRAGLHNVKVYHVLDGSRIERVVDPRWLRSNLFRDTRDFIFQHSLVKTDVQRLHLCVVPSWPILQLVHQLPPPAFRDFRKAWRALEAAHATRLAPQLIAFDYRRGRLDVASATVYLHRSLTAVRPRRTRTG